MELLINNSLEVKTFALLIDLISIVANKFVIKNDKLSL